MDGGDVMKLSLSHVRLLVPNIRECFLFYRDFIGLDVRYGNEDTPFAEFQTGNINLALEPLMVDEPVVTVEKTAGSVSMTGWPSFLGWMTSMERLMN
jgi:catechol 2,3-dioxygenase-like lactoylglutathione lyase family enzyme